MYESFNWNKCYLTGLKSVDDQHRSLVDIINQFSDKMTSQDICNVDLTALYSKLANYATYHFKEEEQLMKSSGIDPRHIRRHEEAHHHFLEEIADLFNTIETGGIEQARFLLKFLIQWLAFHILGIDKSMSHQISLVSEGTPADVAYEKVDGMKCESAEPLVQAVTGLFEQVSIRNRQLKALNSSLEQKVLERTRELDTANEKLEILVITDALTGLPNRRFALKCLEKFWNLAKTQKQPLSCIMIDADNFKQVNDNYGHDAGDEVLKALSAELQNAFRTDDVVCRLAGDEFIAICPNTDINGAKCIAETVRNCISQLSVATGGDPWKGSISVGVATTNDEMSCYKALIKAADVALYRAKSAGRDCVSS